jgi:hypothetical protein
VAVKESEDLVNHEDDPSDYDPISDAVAPDAEGGTDDKVASDEWDWN